MLGLSSTTMGYKSCAIKFQPILGDPELLELFREFQTLCTQYNKLEETPDPTYTSLSKGMIKTYARFEKMVKEQTTSSDDSLSSSLYVHKSPSLRSSSSFRATCSNSRHQLSLPTRSKGLF